MKTSITLFSLLLFFNTGIFAQANQTQLAVIKKNADAFYIPAATIKKFNFKATTGSPGRKAYENLANPKLIVLDDYRWEAASRDEALSWYNDKLNMLEYLGGNDKDITNKMSSPVGVDAWNVYEMNDEAKKMGEIMGLKQSAYSFTFIVDRYVAKIYIQVDAVATLKEAWDLAKEGLKATLSASGKTSLAAQVK
ncbi:MAG: hypothetical protein ABI666_12265 [Ferruginibacter sp.]